jgi:phage-related minor tail protein
MGEAGPEGILPLQRMGDGRLGVSTSGLDGSAGITIIQNNTFQGGADKATLAAWAAQVKQETMRAVSSEIARNGPMAKVVRSA